MVKFQEFFDFYRFGFYGLAILLLQGCSIVIIPNGNNLVVPDSHRLEIAEPPKLRYLPICFYDPGHSGLEEARASWPEVQRQLTSVISLSSNTVPQVSIVNSTRAVAALRDGAFSSLREVWPQAACIGSEGGTEAPGRRQICRAALARSLDGFEITSTRDHNITEPECLSFN